MNSYNVWTLGDWFYFLHRAGALFTAMMNVAFLASTALEGFINRRALFMWVATVRVNVQWWTCVFLSHERTSGFYSVPVYFLVTVLFDLLPLRFMPTIISCPIAYYMIGEKFIIILYYCYKTLILLLELQHFCTKSLPQNICGMW